MLYVNIRKDEKIDETGAPKVVWGLSGSFTPIDGRPYQYLVVLTQEAILSDGARKYLFAVWGLKETLDIDFDEELFDQNKLESIEPPFFEAHFLGNNPRQIIDKIDEMLNRMKDYDYQLDIWTMGKEISHIAPKAHIRRQYHLG